MCGTKLRSCSASLLALLQHSFASSNSCRCFSSVKTEYEAIGESDLTDIAARLTTAKEDQIGRSGDWTTGRIEGESSKDGHNRTISKDAAKITDVLLVLRMATIIPPRHRWRLVSRSVSRSNAYTRRARSRNLISDSKLL